MSLSLLSSLLATFFLPPLLGGMGIYFGYQAYKRDAKVGTVCMAIAGVATIIGFIMGALWGVENIRI